MTAINAHTHLYSGLAPFGMPPPRRQPENFVQILEEVWWRLDRALDEASLRASARLYVAEALLAGTTTLIDHHESPELIEGSLDVLADACQELGCRALVCYGATERNGGRAEARRGLAECARFLRENRRPLVRGAIALHASFTVSDDTVVEAGALCRELGSVLHVHVAEDAADVEDARRRGYAGVVDRFEKLGALVEGSIFAHGVHLTEPEVRALAERRIWLVQNPRSNRGNKVGYPRALAHSDRVALGTDGYPADMAEEARVLCELATENEGSEAPARARIEAGRRLADERFGAGTEVLVEGTPEGLSVGGRTVVQGGALLTGDVDSIRATAREEATKLFERMARL